MAKVALVSGMLAALCGVASARPASPPPEAASPDPPPEPSSSGSDSTAAPAPGDSVRASIGWFAEGGLGAVAFLSKASGDAAAGPALDLRIGRDLFSWLSVGISLAASSHHATVPPPPIGEWFQLYRGGGDARINLQLARMAVFVEGGAGLAMISSNILGKVGITDPGEHYSIAFTAGAGVEYQLENRHYAVGLAGDAFVLPQFAAIRGLDARLDLRYTY